MQNLYRTRLSLVNVSCLIMMVPTVQNLEEQLDHFSDRERKAALQELLKEVKAGKLKLPQPSTDLNLHSHTFFSYNAYGYSPSKFAWLARKRGLFAAGIVDFDVLDGLDEFLDSGRLLGLKTVVSIESRVFVPEFETRVINSPGEPGIAYNMGVGFTTTRLSDWAREFLVDMRHRAEKRNCDLLSRVNNYMRPVELDYERDVLPLTPKGNATERHICEAYERTAIAMFADVKKRETFWREKLGDAPSEGARLQNLIRAKTMKKGGVGYVQPGKDSFPLMADMNRFTLEAGAIPTLAWLDGTSDGEQCMEELLQVATRCGTAAIAIIPDRNYSPGVKDKKLQNLYNTIALAEKHNLPIHVGTEMNSPGNKFVDDFATAELKPLLPKFRTGAHIFYAHSVLQQRSGLGYLSAWAQRSFATVRERNEFFGTFGKRVAPDQEEFLTGLEPNVTPERLLASWLK
jgi:hypothetical protein